MDRKPDPQLRPDTCLNASLHHLVLETRDPARLAAFYSEALGYVFERDGADHVGRARDRHLILTPGEDKKLSRVGYAVPLPRDLSGLRDRIAEAGWASADGSTVLFNDAVTVRDPDGNTVVLGTARPDPALVTDGQALPARIQHAVVASRDPQRILAFYIDVLGFTLSDNVTDEEGGVRTSFVRSSHEHHSFAVFKAAEDRLDHHCYETTDWNMIRDWCDRMAAAHVPIKWGPGRHGPGNNLFIFIHDPDGNWVEISAELEQVVHDRPVGTWPHEQRTLNSWGQGLLRS